MDGPLYDVLSKLFKELIKINILIPGEFRSAKNEEAIKCSVKASDGYLYPLKSSLMFIHKPVHYIKLSEIKFVEFSRIGQLGGSGMPSRSFDMTVTKMKDDKDHITFAGIDKAEQKNLMAYLKSKNVKMRSVDVETNQHIDLSSEDEDEPMEEGKGRGGKRVANKAPDEEEYDSEEDDESFKDDGSEGAEEVQEGSAEAEDEDGDEYGEEEGSGSDEDMELDADELKDLQKEATGITGGRGARRAAKGGNDSQASGAEKGAEKSKDKKDKKKEKKRDKKSKWAWVYNW